MSILRLFRPATTPPADHDRHGLPIHHGPGVSDCCHVEQGQAHMPGCEQVSAEQFAEMIRRQNAER
ncbi:hypothetical protein ABT336_12040 [Micromonospora sp. NPDC000207]|uniref:hypothetical protein n=1 Tax=Micromonospora sp. NPDC000207 TaxID=3154246 RepID=UPI003329BEB6